MELDSLLIQVQGALISIKRNHGLQRDPQDKDIKNAAFYQALERIINTCSHSERDMRRVHLYLLLNSDFKFNETLIEDENFSHIVSTTPTVDKYLLVETFLMLEFEKYVNETIIFGHPSVCDEYLDAIYTVLESQRYVHFIPLIESFITVIHRKLSLPTSGANEYELDILKRKLTLHYEQLLTLFSPPHDKYKMGYVVKSLLTLLNSFLDHHYDFPIPVDSDHSLYVMSLPYVQRNVSKAAIIDFKEKEDIRLILSLLISNLLLVDLTTWMDWFEMEWKSTNRDSTTRNMQQVVGELAYICKEKLNNIHIKFPDVEIIITGLSSMAIKPYSEDEEIRKTDNLVEILQKVKDESLQPESRKKWLVALLSIPKSLTENDCFKCVEEFGSYLSSCEELLSLLERVGELISDETPLYSLNSEKCSNNVENIKRTLLKIFSQACLEDQGKIMALYFAKYGFSNMFASKDYDKIITEYLNKAVNSSEEGEEPISESCVLCLQSPSKYFQGILAMAICNGQMTFVMSVLKPLSDLCQLRLENQHYCEDGSINTKARFLCEQINTFIKRRHWNEVESSNFVQLVIQVQKCAILHQDDIFKEILYPNVKGFLENKSWNSIDLLIKTMYELISKSDTCPTYYQNPAVLPAVLLQVLEKGRQEMREEFSSSAASTCELLASYLPEIIEKFIGANNIEGKSLEWLKARVLCSSPLSKIYFSSLLDSTNAKDNFKSFKKLLMLLLFQSTEAGEANLLELLRNQPKILSYSLLKLLPSCTTSEWINIMHTLKQTVKLCQTEKEQNLLIANIIFTLSNVLLVMVSVIIKKNSSENKESLHIIELYMKNFVRIIKEEFWPCIKYVGLEKACEMFQKIVNLLELIPNEGNVQEECGLLALNILSDIIQSIPHENFKNSQSDPVVLQLATSISLLSDMESRKCLSRMLMENIGKYCSTV